MKLKVLALVALFASLCACDGAITEGSKHTDRGTWFEVRPPPNAPAGVECWIWQVGSIDSRATAAYCFVPEEGSPGR